MIIAYIALLIVIIFLATKVVEKYYMGTYTNTPYQSTISPTWVTDWYWYDRYIDRPWGHTRYAAIPYFTGPIWPRRRHRRRRWRRHHWVSSATNNPETMPIRCPETLTFGDLELAETAMR